MRRPGGRQPDRGGWADDVLAAIPPWVAGRVATLAALAVSRYLVSHGIITQPAAVARVHEGLFGWDAGFYRGIAQHGYGPIGREALRFFPLVPLLARGLGLGRAQAVAVALVVLVNVSALVAIVLLRRLARAETGDAGVAERAGWLLALAPPAFVLVMGYAEAIYLVLALGMFMALRSRRWWAAAALGVAAALARPVGLLLVVPALVEVTRGWWWARRAGARPVRRSAAVARAAAVAGPALGTAVFLTWSRVANGDALLPLRVQQRSTLRGGLVDPFTAVAHAARGVADDNLGTALHAPWAVLLAGLAIVALRRLPVSYGAFAVVALLAALSSRNLDSLERYGLSAFPFALAGAIVTSRPWVERLVLTMAAAGLVAYALLAFTNAYVP